MLDRRSALGTMVDEADWEAQGYQGDCENTWGRKRVVKS